METDLQLTVKGLTDEVGRNVGNVVSAIIRAFDKTDAPLDFRRMHRIIAASDFEGELAELSSLTASGRAITYTKETYALAVAQVLLLPSGDDFEILPVFNANALIPLT